MHSILKNVWKDSVWSEVISAVIIVMFAAITGFIKAVINHSSFGIVFMELYTYKVDLWAILLFDFFLLFIFYLSRKTFKYDEETLKLDRGFFNKIRNTHLTTDMMLAPKTNTFSSNPFIAEDFRSITRVLEESDKADFEFINPHLNKLKNSLIEAVENFRSVTSGYIYGTNNSDWLAIPSE